MKDCWERNLQGEGNIQRVKYRHVRNRSAWFKCEEVSTYCIKCSEKQKYRE
jgi:hypothetical protein